MLGGVLMCGRYLFDPDTGELNEYYKMAFQIKQDDLKIGEIPPSEEVITLGLGEDHKLRVTLTTWGFSNHQNKQLLINARSETLEEKPTFRNEFPFHRCLFPMSGFYEWNKAKDQLLFTLPKKEVMYVAGLYRVKDGRIESVILTTAPNATVEPIHNRMPLIIDKKDARSWLENTKAARKLLHKVDETPLIITPVSKKEQTNPQNQMELELE